MTGQALAPDAASQTRAVTNGTTGLARDLTASAVTGAHWRAPAKPCALEGHSSVAETEGQLLPAFDSGNGMSGQRLRRSERRTAGEL